MDQTALVEASVRDGERLVQELDSIGVPVAAAFWFYFEEYEDWRLVIASRLVDDAKRENRPLQDAYRSVLKAFRNLSERNSDFQLDESDIHLVGLDHKLVQGLGRMLQTGTGISHIRMRHDMVDGIFVEDALVYRLSA